MGLKNLTGLLLNVVCLREHLNLPGMFTIVKSNLVTHQPSYKVFLERGSKKAVFLPFSPISSVEYKNLAFFSKVSNFSPTSRNTMQKGILDMP